MSTPAIQTRFQNNKKSKAKNNSKRKDTTFDYVFKSPEAVFKQVEDNKTDRIIVVCTSLTEAKLCTFLLNTGTSVKFTCIDQVSDIP